MHGQVLAEAAPGCFCAWAQGPIWEEATHTAVSWHPRSNSLGAGRDGRPALIQAALQAVARHVLVDNRGP